MAWSSMVIKDMSLNIDTANQVLIVAAEATLCQVQEELQNRGYCIPVGRPITSEYTLRHLIEWNEPHTLMAQHGTWRDWVLGLTLTMADGTIAKTGSQAIKSVAGYDLQRLIVGSRGSLATITEAILRITPIRSLAADLSKQHGPLETIRGHHRSLPSDFKLCDDAVLSDPASGTIWVSSEVSQEVKPHVQAAMMRAKHLFDPEGRLNPGVWGFM